MDSPFYPGTATPPGVATCASYLVLLAWVLALVAIDSAAAASARCGRWPAWKEGPPRTSRPPNPPPLPSHTPSNAVVWQRFFQNGNNLATLVTAAPVSSAVTSSGCAAVITYEDGGALLSVGTALAFGLSLSVLLTMCCAADTWSQGSETARWCVIVHRHVCDSFDVPGARAGVSVSRSCPPTPSHGAGRAGEGRTCSRCRGRSPGPPRRPRLRTPPRRGRGRGWAWGARGALGWRLLCDAV